jgi:hypothetical protein
VTSPTSIPTQVLSGSKEAGSGIWINGAGVVAPDNTTVWSYQVTLTQGDNNFTIFARDRAGNDSSPISTLIVLGDIAPPPVSTLSVDAAGPGDVAQLDWTGYDEAGQGDIAGYRIFISDTTYADTATMTPVATIAAGNFSYQATGLIEGTTYYFAVVAYDTAGNVDTAVTPVAATPTNITPPQLLSILFNDTDGSGTVSIGDLYVFTFSETMDGTAISNNSINANLILLPAGKKFGTVNKIKWNSDFTQLEIEITPGFILTGDELIDPTDSLTDLAGNPVSNNPILPWPI